MLRIVALTMLLMLSACGPAGFSGDEQHIGSGVGGSTPLPVEEAYSDSATISFSADHVFIPSDDTIRMLYLAEGMSVAMDADGGMLVSGKPASTGPSGKTGGASFVLDESQEQAISGHAVTVRILAKAVDGATMKVAYATDDVGNSGWQQFDLTDTFEEYAFTYDVPVLSRGRKDYVGIQPNEGSVSIAAIGVDIGETVVSEPAESPAD